MAAWLAAVAGFSYAAVSDIRVSESASSDLAGDPSEAIVYGAALLGAASVGLVVAIRQRRHPVGWLFLALGLALAVGAAGDAYALEHLVRTSSLGRAVQLGGSAWP